MAGDIESTPVACRLPDHALLNYTQDEPPLPPPPSPLNSPPIRCSPLHPIHSSDSSSSFCVFYCFSQFTPVRLSSFCYPHSVAASLLPPSSSPSLILLFFVLSQRFSMDGLILLRQMVRHNQTHWQTD